MRWSVVRVGTKDHCKDSAFTLNEKGSYWRVLNKGIPSLIIFKTSIQEVTYIQTFKLWTFKDANLCSINVWRGETAACPGLSLMTLQLYRPPPPRSPPLRSPSCLFTQGQPLDAGCFPTLLYFSRHRAIRLTHFLYFYVCFYVLFVWDGEGNGNPLQFSCLENPMDRGAWQAMIHGVTESRTQLKWLSTLSVWEVLLTYYRTEWYGWMH